jgi:hypothetical protein
MRTSTTEVDLTDIPILSCPISHGDILVNYGGSVLKIIFFFSSIVAIFLYSGNLK